MFHKTDISTGVGSCAQAGTTDDKAFYCANGAECNNFVNKACWDPVSGQAATTLCKANDWQCKVCIVFLKNIEYSSKICRIECSFEGRNFSFYFILTIQKGLI
jgi:hypothetical protein